MEVAIGANNNSTPFQREVREWQRVDPNTGALLSGRLEADRWINGPLNAYGKVVNSQNVSQPNGAQQSQRNQLEVLQARTSSGSLQVVRAQTVQTTSHCWPSSSSSQLSSSGGSSYTNNFSNQSFDDQHFNNGYHQSLTNGYNSIDSHDDHLTKFFSNGDQNSRFLMSAPSIKLSTLMKSNTAAANMTSTAVTNGGRNSPHFPSNSMSLLQQRHQQHPTEHQTLHESKTQSSSFTDGRYHQPTTLGEAHIGVGVINTNQLESLRNERETSTSDREELLFSQNHRGRSASTDDLATEWNQNDEDPESSEWRRVSKIRRSFQFPKSISPKGSLSRPPDLPENSGSVSRIRHELENGRRLNTAMRGNNVDLVALNSILNGTRESETKPIKKATFLTAESLKEIRGKLKKLSDESLYKDDFIVNNNTEDEENECNHSSNGYIVQQPVVLQDTEVVQQSPFQYHPKLEGTYTTNSLENRTRYRDTNSAEWHLRRKSYGFEKMISSENAMFRMETSTDSGIGRSGDLANWSPTESSTTTNSEGKTNNIQKTRVTLNNGTNKAFDRPVQLRFQENGSLFSKPTEIKRHSIAVDEMKYVGGENMKKTFEVKSSSININGFYTKESNNTQSSTSDENGRRQKRVEFCKTEVHFAAESGRVNIVETDGKPPPTNNFRRRRRSPGNNISNAYLEAINSGVPLIHFGDEHKMTFEKGSESEELKELKNNKILIPIKNENCDQVTPKTVVEIEEESNSDEVSLRSILKNKPIKPKPYHLGENIDSGESLWGVRLKPVTKSVSDDEEKDIIKPSIESSLDQTESSDSIKSVAERIKIVEKRKDGTGYSTKVNLNLSSSPYSWNVPDFPKTNIMSIELRSPTSTVMKIRPYNVTPKHIEMPIPKPRTVSPVKITRNPENEYLKTNDMERKSIKKIDPSENKEPLKVVTGGARKLREHELSYFGVKANNQEINVKPSNRVGSSINQANVNAKKVLTNATNINKWKLTSDKPDLLRHSPIASKRTIIPQNPEQDKQQIDNNIDGPIYENLKKPSSYNRKKDVKHNEKDQISKTVNSPASQNRDPDRCSSRRSSEPLDTINEKTVARQSSNSPKKFKTRALQVSRQNADSFQRSCCSNRPSSASSNESLPRFSNLNSIKTTSKTQSKDSYSGSGRIEYANIRSTKKLSPSLSPSARDGNKTRHSRSHSRERQQSVVRSHHSSSEDLANSPKIELIPRIRKSSKSSKDKDTTSSRERDHSRTTTKHKNDVVDHHHKHYREQHILRPSSDHVTKSRTSSHATATISSKSKRSSPATSSEHHSSKTRTKSSSGILSSTPSSSKKRTNREHSRK